MPAHHSGRRERQDHHAAHAVFLGDVDRGTLPNDDFDGEEERGKKGEQHDQTMAYQKGISSSRTTAVDPTRTTYGRHPAPPSLPHRCPQ